MSYFDRELPTEPLYFILTSTQDGWDCVRGLYQANSEESVRAAIEEEWLEYTNDPEKAESDREQFWDKYVLTKRRLVIIES